MKEPQAQGAARIYLGELDHLEHKPLYEWIVLRARELGLAGVTVLRGTMGFGDHGTIHTNKILRLSEDLPVVIEIVDTAQKIENFLADLDGRRQGCLVVMRHVESVTRG